MASEAARPAVPAWFWVVAILALLWEAAGCYAYLTQISMTNEALANLPPEQAELWRAMPVWVKIAYALAVWVGLTGALALLMRQRWARESFARALLAVLIQFGWVYLASPARKTLEPGSAALPAAIIIASAFLLWFSAWAGRRGWLS